MTLSKTKKSKYYFYNENQNNFDELESVIGLIKNNKIQNNLSNFTKNIIELKLKEIY